MVLKPINAHKSGRIKVCIVCDYNSFLLPSDQNTENTHPTDLFHKNVKRLYEFWFSHGIA